MKTIKQIEKEFKGLTAQAYTTNRNKDKVLDPDLLVDIEKIVISFYREKIEEMLNELKIEIKKEVFTGKAIHHKALIIKNDVVNKFNSKIDNIIEDL